MSKFNKESENRLENAQNVRTYRVPSGIVFLAYFENGLFTLVSENSGNQMSYFSEEGEAGKPGRFEIFQNPPFSPEELNEAVEAFQ